MSLGLSAPSGGGGSLAIRNDVAFRAQTILSALPGGGLAQMATMAVPPAWSEAASTTSRLTGGGYSGSGGGNPLNGGRLLPIGGLLPTLTVQSNTYPGGGYEFGTDCDAVDFYCRSGLFQAWAQDLEAGTRMEYCGSFTSTGDKMQMLDFGSFKRRRIRLRFRNVDFGGPHVRPTYSVWKTPRLPRILCFGDSYTNTIGTIAPELPDASFAIRMGDMMGCDVMPAGVGGSGYVSNGSLTYISRVDQVSNYPDADAIVVTGGYNDGAVADATLTAAVRTFVQAIRALNATVPIIGVGTFTVASGTKPAAIKAGWDAEAALDSRVKFIDTIANGYQTPGDLSNDDPGSYRSGIINFTAPLVAATSGTLTAVWGGFTGTYQIVFDDGSLRNATLTNGSAAVSWTGAVTSGVKVFAWMTTTAGNNAMYKQDSGAHMAQAGHTYLGARTASDLVATLKSYL